jgi:hypothetical protein
MLIYKENIVLEARIEVWLEPQMDHDVVVMTIDVGIDTVEALEKLANGGGEVLGEGDADAGGEGRFVVDVRLHPGHEMLDVFGGGHFGGFRVASGCVLPEIFESECTIRDKFGVLAIGV